MRDLVEFLRARLDEDEQAAKLVPQPYRLYVSDEGRLAEPVEDDDGRYVQWADGEDRMPNHINNWELVYDPARVLREIEAKRRIIHAHARPHECISLTERGEHSVVDGQPWELWEPQHTADSGPCFVLRCLALPYADHPDYDEEWRP